MDQRLIVAIAVVVSLTVLIAYARRRAQINHAMGVTVAWVGRFVSSPKTCKVAEQFLVEAAVLWFVFPVLDAIYEHKSVTDPALRGAYLAALLCFLGAVALSHVAEGD